MEIYEGIKTIQEESDKVDNKEENSTENSKEDNTQKDWETMLQGATNGMLQETQQKTEVIELGRKITQITTKQEGNIITKLPIGTYIIKQPEGQSEVIQNQGYVTLENYVLEVQDTLETKTITLEQDYTKVAVNLLDKDTKEAVIRRNLEYYKQRRKRTK